MTCSQLRRQLCAIARILAAPDAGVEILQYPAGHVRVRRPVDRFEFSGDRLAVFP